MSQVPPWETWTWEGIPDHATGRELADTVERSTANLLAAVARISDDVLAMPRTFDTWSGHDLLAHCLAWAEISAEVLQGIVAGTLNLDDYRYLPTHDESEDDLNQRQVEALRDVSTDELLRRLERARDTAADALRRFEGDPPVALVLLTFGIHFDDHAGAFRKVAGV